MLLFWLFTKHLIVDFFLQRPYQWMNKGTYGHPGGLEHAGLHAAATAFIVALLGLGLPAALAVGLLDGVVHYHIDWAKMNVNKHYGWKAESSEKFWWLLGADQYLHTLTYLGIASLV